MAESWKQFVSALETSGIFTEQEVAALRDRCISDIRLNDSKSLAGDLVREGKLTEFQAVAILQGQQQALSFGEYLVIDRIGDGGMGVIFKAEHRRMKRVVAIKQLTDKYIRAKEARQRFYREVELAAKLIHPNIVTAFDAGEAHGVLYLVMEYVDGQDLFALVRQKGPLPIDEAVDYILQAARGLAFAHRQGGIHRDIKPGNILVSKQGAVKMLDMSLARIEGPDLHSKDALTIDGGLIGTVEYMAPEQAQSAREVDGRADIYSLGCVFYRILTKKLPYYGDNPIQIAFDHRESPIPSLLNLRPDMPQELESVYLSMMAKRCEDRFQSADELIAALQHLIDTGVVGRFARPDEPESAATPKMIPIARPRTDPSGNDASSSDVLVNQLANLHEQPSASPSEVEQKTALSQQQTQERATSNRRWIMMVGGAIVLLLGVIVFISSMTGPGDGGASLHEPAASPVNVTASTVPAGASQLLADKWYDLLPMVSPATNKKWRIGAGNIQSDSENFSRIGLPIRMIDGEYRLRFHLQRWERNECTTIILPIGKKQVYMVIGGWGNTVTGFGDLDNSDGHPAANETRDKTFKVQEGRKYLVEVLVKPTGGNARVIVWVDRRKLVDWTGKQSRIQMLDAWRIGDESAIGLGSFATRSEFSDIYLKVLNGKAELKR